MLVEENSKKKKKENRSHFSPLLSNVDFNNNNKKNG